MMSHFLELPIGKRSPSYMNTSCTTIKVFRLALTISTFLIVLIPLYLVNDSSCPWLYPKDSVILSSKFGKKCNIFRGRWIPYSDGPYYTNGTCREIFNQQTCMKFGRPEYSDFLKWRWKPDECELPLFDAVQFLEHVKRKSMAFIGDSLGRNQMQSPLCLLARV